MSKRINKQLVCDALIMALWRRGFPKGVIVHTDRGAAKKCLNILRLITTKKEGIHTWVMLLQKCLKISPMLR